MIKELEVKDLRPVAEWLHQMNEEDKHFVAWLASDPKEIFEQIWGLTQLNDPFAFVAWDGDEIIGFLGILPFFEQRVCRLLGPIATRQESFIIEKLWQKASLTLEMYFNAAKMACFDVNAELLAFAEHHEFELYNIEKTLLLTEKAFTPSFSSSSSIAPVDEEHYKELDALHPDGAYYETKQMLDLSYQQGNRLFGYFEEGELSGYVYLETILPEEEGEICFVNVTQGEQGEGIGTALLEYALAIGFEEMNFSYITISVRETNRAAESLYRRIGFEEWHTIYAYNKTIEKQPPPTLIH
ncbi:GNAT family N-acetyltransferase [Salimicrobium halophilum]|uniref:Acetyltransferase (GNAT) family protein n=1 Tax=Salimicrobium halophilum TaxID=86666 RepID=A0A1G8SQI3_9BACI|nr:GNAT family N-acetyltransferase [Salimicrobium halophilum]SDJ31528.1 Acetyltransferase (GNAT) family protein [Salimicrobium halophilum]